MKKKLLVIVSLIVACFTCFAACGGGGSGSSAGEVSENVWINSLTSPNYRNVVLMNETIQYNVDNQAYYELSTTITRNADKLAVATRLTDQVEELEYSTHAYYTEVDGQVYVYDTELSEKKWDNSGMDFSSLMHPMYALALDVYSELYTFFTFDAESDSYIYSYDESFVYTVKFKNNELRSCKIKMTYTGDDAKEYANDNSCEKVEIIVSANFYTVEFSLPEMDKLQELINSQK